MRYHLQVNAHEITLNSVFLACLHGAHKDLAKNQRSTRAIHTSTYCLPEETKKDPE